MDPLRFRPQLEEIEGRLTPAALTPEQVFAAASLADFYYTGTHAALADTSFIRQQANRAPTQALAAVIINQSQSLADTLGQYVTQLRNELAAAPAYADFFNQGIDHFMAMANEARLAGVQAQQVSTAINGFNAASAAQANSTANTNGTLTNANGLNTTGLNTTTLNGNNLPNSSVVGNTPNLGNINNGGTTTNGTTTNGTTTGGTTTGGTTTSGTDSTTGNTTGGTGSSSTLA